jgi:hypothetical protein
MSADEPGEPMYHTDRSDGYARQRGITPGIWPCLTPRQQRRYWQKLRARVGGPRENYPDVPVPDRVSGVKMAPTTRQKDAISQGSARRRAKERIRAVKR